MKPKTVSLAITRLAALAFFILPSAFVQKAGWVAEHVCAEVPHRQFVFTIPKRLRIYFRFDRRLLGELCRAAARTVITVCRASSGRPDAAPGMIGAIQTFGQLVHWHPHIHALVTEGVFLPEGAFLPLPKLASEPFLKLWEQEVFALLLAEGRITEDVVVNMRSWKHSGVCSKAIEQGGCMGRLQAFPLSKSASNFNTPRVRKFGYHRRRKLGVAKKTVMASGTFDDGLNK